jgi:hypothetical protein
MYYDRCVPRPLLNTILPGRCLSWLVSWVRSDRGKEMLADLQLRGTRDGACLQLYVGATSVLAIHLTRQKVRFRTAKDYAAVAPSLFARTHDTAALAEPAARDSIEQYLKDVRSRVADRYLTLESEVHGGFMRRYALEHAPSDPCLVIDREVKIGYASIEERSSIRLQLEASLPASLRGNHTELDAIAVLGSGQICVVELKDEGHKGLAMAAKQAAAHVLRFGMLDQKQASWRRSLHDLCQQKADANLLPAPPELREGTPLVPVIAASDDQPGWVDRWRAAVRPILSSHPTALSGLRLWRLSRAGCIEEEATA